MADEVESPLSSPPGSVIKVRGNSPPIHDDDVDNSGDRRESITGSSITDMLAKVAARRETTNPNGANKPGKEEEQEEATAHGSDDEDQSTAPKRKGRSVGTSAPAKKPRHALAAPRIATKAAPRKSAQDKKWEAPFVLTDSKSPLATADLRVRTSTPHYKPEFTKIVSQAILLLPEAWEVLTQVEKLEVLAKFPDETHILDAGTPNARPNLVSLRNDDNFRHDCARYCENLEAGRHDEKWLGQAWVAHEQHERGEFDEFLREQFEEEWGVELPDDSQPEDNQLEDLRTNHESKRDTAEPSERCESAPPTIGKGAPASTRSSRQSTQSRQTPARASSPQDLRGKTRDVAARQAPRNRAAVDKRTKRQPTKSPSVKLNNPPETSQDREGESIVVAQPKQKPVTPGSDSELEKLHPSSLARLAKERG